MRISDWSSDVCSSDLRVRRVRRPQAARPRVRGHRLDDGGRQLPKFAHRDGGRYAADLAFGAGRPYPAFGAASRRRAGRSEEHTSELQSLMRISSAVFCLKKKKIKNYKSEHYIKAINT